MAEFYDEIPDKLAVFIEQQPIFFVATAAAGGRINLSPKGMDSFRVLGTRQVAYLDLTGSGNETAAHLQHDGRITVMFCSFSRNPLILRLYGHGTTVQAGSERWNRLAPQFPDYPGARQIIVIDVVSVQTSCGYGVPEMKLIRERPTLAKWAEAKGEDGLAEYRRKNNAVSIDGLKIT
ncbi:MAG: pyridoxamine 5'-phosphate oxidase family protein [Alphaproteobacteria bacterium]|nr:MAG: pyridoxamine 5'-phosphate oxidase family protein [Alphaproteobacteria bacterium]